VNYAFFQQFITCEKKMTANFEQTFLMVKPDAFQRGLIGEIITSLEKKVFCLNQIKVVAQPTQEIMEKHYEHLSNNYFYEDLIKFMISGPVVCMVWSGYDIIETAQRILGRASFTACELGSLRSQFASSTRTNACHASDSKKEAEREINLWFPEGVPIIMHGVQQLIYKNLTL